MKSNPQNHTNLAIRVVYHCENKWDKFLEYTSALTNLKDLRIGWYILK